MGQQPLELQLYRPRRRTLGRSQNVAVVTFTGSALYLNSLALTLGGYDGEGWAHVRGVPGFGEIEVEFVAAWDANALRMSLRVCDRRSICVRGVMDWLEIGADRHGRYPARPRKDGKGVRVDLTGRRIGEEHTS